MQKRLKIKPFKGFTFLELVVVMLVLGLLASLAAPVITTAIQRSKESVLKKNLHVTRQAIDDYFADNGQYPEDLDVLVEDKYLRMLPFDPVVGSDTAWVEEDSESEEVTGIDDIKSSANIEASDGSYYSEW